MSRKPKEATKPRRKPTPEIIGPYGDPVVTLPPSYSFTKAVQIWQGPPKSGKTSTFASLRTAAEKLGLEEEVRPWTMLFEPGSGGVDLYATQEKCDCGKSKDCPECEGLGVRRKILRTLTDIDTWFNWAAESEFNPIGIDTGDAMFQAVADEVCVKLKIRNPTETDHGIAWVNIFDEMREKVAILTAAGKAVTIIMHVYMQERRLRGGGTIQTATFNVSGKSRQFLAGLANQILHFDVVPREKGEAHVILTQPTAGVEAGDHWGLMPEELDRGDSPEEGAEAILKCFYEV